MLAVIQGTADTSGKLTQTEIAKTVDFCVQAFEPTARAEREAVLQKVEALSVNDSGSTDAKTKEGAEVLTAALSADELRILATIRAREMMRIEDSMNIDSFSADAIDGMAPNLKRGSLGLVKGTGAHAARSDVDLFGTDVMDAEEEVKEKQIPISAY